MNKLRIKHVLTAFFMAFFMSGIMSFALEAVNSGFELSIISFFYGWAISFSIALPTVFLIAPLVDALSTRLMKVQRDSS